MLLTLPSMCASWTKSKLLSGIVLGSSFRVAKGSSNDAFDLLPGMRSMGVISLHGDVVVKAIQTLDSGGDGGGPSLQPGALFDCAADVLARQWTQHESHFKYPRTEYDNILETVVDEVVSWCTTVACGL